MIPVFTCDADIARIGEELLNHTLPKARWTHAAHFAAALWLLRQRPASEVFRVVPDIIRGYNVATGVMNTDHGGYHATITRASLRAALHFVNESPDVSPTLLCNELLASALGRPDWLETYWSHSLLFSIRARRDWVAPDIAPLPYRDIPA